MPGALLEAAGTEFELEVADFSKVVPWHRVCENDRSE
jgi:hypothetical protein